MKYRLAMSLALASAGLAQGCEKSATQPRDPSPDGPQLAVVTNEKLAVDEVAVSDCPNGEDVRVTGTIHSLVSITNSASGGFDVHIHTNWSGVKGTSVVTGLRYVAQTTANLSAHFPGPTEGNATTIPGHLSLIGQGNATNEEVHFIIHQTVDAQGNVRSEFEKFTRHCS
jgi:hypothetical protein